VVLEVVGEQSKVQSADNKSFMIEEHMHWSDQMHVMEQIYSTRVNFSCMHFT